MKTIGEVIQSQPEKKKGYKDEYLERFLDVLNEARLDTKYSPLTFGRLNMMLKKFGKSKRCWDRDIFIGGVLSADNPSRCFWGKYRKLDKVSNK